MRGINWIKLGTIVKDQYSYKCPCDIFALQMLKYYFDIYLVTDIFEDCVADSLDDLNNGPQLK